ncbi:MAG TPA: hypothetical protein VFS33_01490 [Gemmatimonadales bacterium]|nr:hypothetical protein [Gemmatimonadales bacterium]
MGASPDLISGGVRASYRDWLDDVQQVIEPAREPEAGVWGRWRAIQYLEHSFAPRFYQEQTAVQALAAECASACTTHLWALGELIALLVDELGDLGQLVQAGASFSIMAGKFLRAFQCWCEEAEQVVRRAESVSLAAR